MPVQGAEQGKKFKKLYGGLCTGAMWESFRVLRQNFKPNSTKHKNCNLCAQTSKEVQAKELKENPPLEELPARNQQPVVCEWNLELIVIRKRKNELEVRVRVKTGQSFRRKIQAFPSLWVSLCSWLFLCWSFRRVFCFSLSYLRLGETNVLLLPPVFFSSGSLHGSTSP